MTMFQHDFRLALATLLRSPGVTVVTIATLALGIGANTAIFSLFNAVVLRPLPVPHPEQLVSLATTISDSVNGEEPFSLQMFQELQRPKQAFSDIFAWNSRGMNNFEAGGRHVTAALAAASGNYYSAMQVVPLLGRFISERDVALANGTSPAVAVISYRAWRNWFRGSPDIIGKTLRIEDRPFTVIGVEPDGFSGLIIDGSADVTVPLFAPGTISDRNPSLLWLRLYGRMKPGVTLMQARASLQGLWPSIQDAAKPPGYEGQRRARFYSRRVSVDGAATGVSTLRKRFSQPLQVLLALVGAVLLIACLNLTNLSLAKSASRQHFSAIRAALGASGWDLVRPALMESFVLSFAGAMLGLVLAYWSSRALLHMAWTGLVETPLAARLDYRVLGFTAAVTFVAGLVSAIVPAWYAATIDPMLALRQNSRSVHGGSSLLGKTMLTFQMALSLMLVMGAFLFGTTLSRFYSVDPGFKKDHLLSLTLFPQAGKRRAGNTVSYYRELLAKVKSIPGVTAASYSNDSPASGFEWRRPASHDPKSDPMQAIESVVSPDFFATAGVKIVRGREFDWKDDDQKAPVAIVSKSLADRLFGIEDPIGQGVYWGPVPYQDRLRVIGVVDSASLWKVDSVRPLALYRSTTQNSEYGDFSLNIRTAVDPRALKAIVEKTVHSLGRHYPLQTMTVEERLETYLTVQRLTAILASFFGGVALLLAAVGLYGLLSYQVTLRTTEIGIRFALGAGRWEVLSSILGPVLLLAGAGCGLGLIGTLAVRSLVGSLLYGVPPTDPTLLAFSTLTLLAVAVLAGLVPAARAAAVDASTALRME